MTDKIHYIVALIAEFAEHYGLTDAQAARCISHFGALQLCDEHYEIMHTLTFHENIENIATYCRRMGGKTLEEFLKTDQN